MMALLPNIIFIFLLSIALFVFRKNILQIKTNIQLGRAIDRTEDSGARWANMARIALGQSKMVKRPLAGFLHIIVYIGFILINIELLEIVVDGVLGTHRIFAPYLGSFYNVLIASFEVLAFLVLIAVVIFWTRRNVVRIQRFWKDEMKGWPKLDADLILYFEIVLMGLFLTMNAADLAIQLNHPDAPHYMQAGSFPISQFLLPIFDGMALDALILVERSAWWMHIIGIMIFLNYLYYSKHLHILLAFPNTFYSNLAPLGKFNVDSTIKNEVTQILFPERSQTPNEALIEKCGASDVFDLKWTQLMNAYSCTECGRCTEVCPANKTGKKLSPRKIMMDTRDRLEEGSRNRIVNKGVYQDDQKQLLNDYISPEELWACTSCNACVEACPIAIDPPFTFTLS